MKLLIDAGNTRLKSALWDGRCLEVLASATHAGAADEVDLSTMWNSVGAVDAVLIASVAGAALGERLTQALGTRFGRAPAFVTTPAFACGVRNAYAQPERLGIDRFLGLVALHASGGGPYVLASCGTALTLDALATDGTHLGGLICASPPLMLDALIGGTARLARPQHARIVELADNTAEAIESGVWLAGAALIERFVARAATRLGTRPALVLTGGGAGRLDALIEPPHRVDAELVLRGLAIHADSVR